MDNKLLWSRIIMFSSTLLIAAAGIPLYLEHNDANGWVWLAGFLFLGANGMSITAGYHRLWSHRAYEASLHIQFLLAIFGAAALQNSILTWASDHRRHHKHADKEHDPYAVKDGLWHAHIGWMLTEKADKEEDFSNCPDLLRNKLVVWQHTHYLTIATIMNILPVVLCGYLTGAYLESFLVVGILRLVLSHHTTFFINSLAHYWGNTTYSKEHSARDNGILALFTYGEGYHNYHHTFQGDYRNGIRWWQFDPTKWMIWTLSIFRLTKNLRRIDPNDINQALASRNLQVLGGMSSGMFCEHLPLRKIFVAELCFHDALCARMKEVKYKFKVSRWSSEEAMAALEAELQEVEAEFAALVARLKRIIKSPYKLDWWIEFSEN